MLKYELEIMIPQIDKVFTCHNNWKDLDSVLDQIKQSVIEYFGNHPLYQQLGCQPAATTDINGQGGR